MSIQTSLTGRSILAEKRRKKKNQEKEKVKSFVVEKTNRTGQKKGDRWDRYLFILYKLAST